jgi:hypothetical protein
MAMGKIGGTSYSADATVAAVKLSLVFVVQKNTDGTPVGTEGCRTRDARLTRHLFRVA